MKIEKKILLISQLAVYIALKIDQQYRAEFEDGYPYYTNRLSIYATELATEKYNWFADKEDILSERIDTYLSQKFNN